MPTWLWLLIIGVIAAVAGFALYPYPFDLRVAVVYWFGCLLLGSVGTYLAASLGWLRDTK